MPLICIKIKNVNYKFSIINFFDTSDPSDALYNILGQPVDDTYHGIVIRNGKKMLQ